MYINIKYGEQQTIYFPMIKAGETNFAVAADWTPVAADCDLSIDGGTWTQATNTVAIAVTGAPLWKLTLTANETKGTTIAIAIVDAATKAVEDQALICTTTLGAQLAANEAMPVRISDNATFTGTTTALEAEIVSDQAVEATADHYNGRLILFLDGALRSQMTDITDYENQNGKEKFTFTAVTEAVPDNTRFIVL